METTACELEVITNREIFDRLVGCEKRKGLLLSTLLGVLFGYF